MTAKSLTPAQVAKALGHGRNFVMQIIEAGELQARDERVPGSSRPRYRIDPDAIEAWKVSRRVVPAADVLPIMTLPRLDGVLRKRTKSHPHKT